MDKKFEILPLRYEYDAMDGISKQVMTWHHDKHYAAYVNGRNAVEAKLAAMRESGDFTGIRAVLEEQSFHQSGQVLHEMFFDILGGDGKADGNLAVVQMIELEWGSLDLFVKEFTAAATSSRNGWVLLVYDPKSKRLHTAVADFHHHFAMWGAIPVLGLDMWEHAYYYDQGPNKAAYAEAFFKNIDWAKVNEFFENAR